MTSKESTGTARTPPKGEATRSRSDRGARRSLVPTTMQWVLVVIVGLLIFAAIAYFGSDVGDDLGGGDQVGTSAPSMLVSSDPLASRSVEA